MQYKERYLTQLDALRGMATFLVVWGHLIDNNSILFRYINNLHLPLFFVISGYLLSNSVIKYDIKALMMRKIYRLLLPFITWSGVALLAQIISAVLKNEFDVAFFINSFKNTFLYANSAWFLLVLFLGTVLILIYERSNNKVVFWGFMILIYLFFPNDILKLGKLKIMFPIFCSGYFIHKNQLEMRLGDFLAKRHCGQIIGIMFLVLLYFKYDKTLYIEFTEFLIPLVDLNVKYYLYFWCIQLMGLCFNIYILHPLLCKLHLVKLLNITSIYSMDIYMQHMFLVKYLVLLPSGYFQNYFLLQASYFLYSIVIIGCCIGISKYLLYKIGLYRFFMKGSGNFDDLKLKILKQ